MKTPAFVIAMMFARVKDVKATCYEAEGVELADCTCHESCATCGYSYYDLSEDIVVWGGEQHALVEGMSQQNGGNLP